MNYQLPIIYIGADHAGFDAKEALKQVLSDQYRVEDLGASSLVPDDDYPPIARAVAEAVAANLDSRGILLCGNGQGMCIAANKIKGIRAVSSWSPDHASSTRTDDDANVLCLAARFLDAPTIEAIAKRWLETDFSGADRHRRRLEQIRADE